MKIGGEVAVGMWICAELGVEVMVGVGAGACLTWTKGTVVVGGGEVMVSVLYVVDGLTVSVVVGVVCLGGFWEVIEFWFKVEEVVFRAMFSLLLDWFVEILLFYTLLTGVKVASSTTTAFCLDADPFLRLFLSVMLSSMILTCCVRTSYETKNRKTCVSISYTSA